MVCAGFAFWSAAGGTLQSPAGLLSIDELNAIELDDITDEDARAAGYDDRTEAVAELRPEGTLYRVRFFGRLDGAEPGRSCHT